MSRDRSATATQISGMIQKLQDPDPDIRFMQLSDLQGALSNINTEWVRNDIPTAGRVIEGVVHALGDQNGEVQNQALKCIGPLAARTPNELIAPTIDKITQLLTASDIDHSVPNSALRSLVASLPHPQVGNVSVSDVKEAYSAISKVLIPRLVGRVVLSGSKSSAQPPFGLLQPQKGKGYNADAVDVLIEIVKHYGTLLQDKELIALAQAVMDIIESPQAGGVVKKRALAGVGALLVHFSESQVSSFVDALAQSFKASQISNEHRRYLIATIGTLAKSTPKFGPYLHLTIPHVLSALQIDEDEEDDQSEDAETDAELEEMREAALQTLDALLGSCPTEMAEHQDDALAAALRFLNSLSASDHDTLFNGIAPSLLSRLHNEREDNVRLEVISATTTLIKKAGSSSTVHRSEEFEIPPTTGRKRRRQDSEVSQHDPELRGLVLSRASPPITPSSPPASGAQADLAAVIPKMVQALGKMWKKAGIPLKQAGITMIKILALSRNGALADHLQQLEDPIADALKPGLGPSGASASSGSSSTVAGLQIETLGAISTITETNSTAVLTPFVIALIPSVTAVARGRNDKVSGEALATLEQFVKALTPPRLSTPNQDHAIHIEKLFDVIVNRVTDNNTDLEVRHRAIQVFGVLIARTSSTQLISSAHHAKALGILNDRLRNETTRLASARAIGLVGESAGVSDNVSGLWVQEVSMEMANQLRKADRALRAACLEALQYLALNTVTATLYDTKTIAQLKEKLLPLLATSDLNLLTPALVILARILPTSASDLITDDLIEGLCAVSKTRLEGSPLKAYLLVIKVIAEQGVGNGLMQSLLAIGIAGDTLVLGRAIGTLLVFSTSQLAVSVPTFLTEIQTSTNPEATCLAITVLGEVGFRTGAKSPVQMDVFTGCLNSTSDRVRLAAATALGSASSSNLSACLPFIIENLGQNSEQEYLYLHSLKEILQHVTDSDSKDFVPFAQELWQKLFGLSTTDDTRAVAAECIGRVAMIEPQTYVPLLTQSLQSPDATTRGTVISAFRFTLADPSSAYNTLLARTIVPMLRTMLSDADLSNRRLAVTTLNAAIHNKPNLVIPEIGQLLPQVLDDSVIKPDLIRVITIGPFKHNEDGGLDLRKATYATLYALLDCPAAIPHLPIPRIFDRILDGITDDADIRTLCNLMLARLTVLDPEETRRRLSPLAEKFKVVLGVKLKENAVKQEIEKANEANAAVIRTSLELDRNFENAAGEIAGGGEMVGWKGYIEMVRKEFAAVVRGIQQAEGT
ncbi:Cullin-associated NEDD8-dissociated protein 1, C-terminal part [Cyphellophora attinorum]|uniref:Cullin-associated NEDD8-dissociated protein 1, C-terminal part n=1 Tax=Cyphellophora attinorum TaxID=1664694 RepID=A0A0N1HR40_9EURO|nr:Cullin-associated NEDD8-dissociated protein 1, C-terminal part [Phialophora attinorum]KPI38132.1 Cullin-associated NEDD8-dissociated protein 1, C-terminal part [Phialophora attinorum]